MLMSSRTILLPPFASTEDEEDESGNQLTDGVATFHNNVADNTILADNEDDSDEETDSEEEEDDNEDDSDQETDSEDSVDDGENQLTDGVAAATFNNNVTYNTILADCSSSSISTVTEDELDVGREINNTSTACRGATAIEDGRAAWQEGC